MDEKVLANPRIYTDIQSLGKIKYDYTKNPKAATQEIAQQFQAILMQMVMSSMREANKTFANPDEDDCSSSQMDMYQDMFDKQLSLATSQSQTSLASIIEKNIDTHLIHPKSVPAMQPVNSVAQPQSTASTSSTDTSSAVNDSPAVSAPQPAANTVFKTPEDFIKNLWSASKQAAGMLGLSPELLLAQAALETNWGKNITQAQGVSSHNLFNIKAGPEWNNKTVTMDTLEQNQGVLVKEKAAFRKYDNFQDSFQDYVHFLQSNDRYSQALSKTDNPGQFMSLLQKAGYATDENYAEKVMKIYNSKSFQQAVMKSKPII